MIGHYLAKLYGSIPELELSVVVILYVPVDDTAWDKSVRIYGEC